METTEVGLDDSFKRPGAVPFKWEIQPGVPKPHPKGNPSSAQPRLHPPPSRAQSPARFGRSASASPARRRGFHARSTSPSHFPSASPSPSRPWKLPSPPAASAAAVSPGCFFPAVSPLRRRDERKEKGSSEPSRWSSVFSSPFGRSSRVAEEAASAARWLF